MKEFLETNEVDIEQLLEEELKLALAEKEFTKINELTSIYRNIKEANAFMALSDISLGMKDALANFVPDNNLVK